MSGSFKVALLDRRFVNSRAPDNHYITKHGVPWYNPDYTGNGNTFAFIDAFGEVMTAPLQVNIDYSPLKDYDLLYLRARDHNCAEAIKQLREQCPDPVIICYSDESVNTCINGYMWDYYKWIGKASKYCDAMTSSFPEKYERPKHDALGVTNYHHCPYAGDVEHWKKWYTEDKTNYITGMWHIRGYKAGGCGDAIHSRTLRTMKRLQDKFGVECKFFLNFDGWKLENQIRQYVQSIDLKVELLRHMDNSKFNEVLAKAKLFLEEYQSPAYSRATVVSACVGTPQIGTDFNTPSTVCFPFTTSVHGDWGSWLKLAEKCLTDERFYSQVQRESFKYVDWFYYPAYYDRLMELYERLRK